MPNFDIEFIVIIKRVYLKINVYWTKKSEMVNDGE